MWKRKDLRDGSKQEIIPLRVSRRAFLKGSGAAVAVAGIGVIAGCEVGTREPQVSPGTEVPGAAHEYLEAPPVPTQQVEADNVLHFFTPAEAQTVDALVSRILPGDSSDPGAHEAGVLYFIDYALSHSPAGDGWNEPHYSSGPFAKTYTGSTPPGPDTSTTVYVKKSELPRYGYQSKLNPQEVFRKGLVSLDAYANSKFGSNFRSLSSGDQDSVVGDLADGSASGFSEPSVKTFWSMVRDQTVYGMFADPFYGGNRNFVGWTLVGYPGAQRAYTPQDLLTPGNHLETQSLAQLPHLHVGLPSHNPTLLPVSGSYQQPGTR